MTSRAPVPLVLLLLIVIPVRSVIAETSGPSSDPAAISLAVSPFTTVRPIEGQAAGPAIPGVSAERAAAAFGSALAGHERVEVVGPEGVAALGIEPRASEVRAVARRAATDRVVTARIRPGRIGNDFDFEVRSGHSGAVVGEFAVREVQPAGLEEAMQTAAAGVLGDLGVSGAVEEAAAAGSLPAVSAAGAGGAAESARRGEDGLIGELRSDEPISIESDELEFLNAEAQRHLIFRRNVKVVQGDVELRTSRLEAFYPEGSNQPDRFVATGGVEVWQGERRARCERATYLREDQVVVCTGEATLLQNCDEVRGDRIEFDLEAERVRVVGAASILIQEDCEEGQ